MERIHFIWVQFVLFRVWVTSPEEMLRGMNGLLRLSLLKGVLPVLHLLMRIRKSHMLIYRSEKKKMNYFPVIVARIWKLKLKIFQIVW